MIRWALPALLVLAGCTGQNVDEAFLAEHGALLARVDCTSVAHSRYRYQAIMFLDGSVMAWGPPAQQEFYERGYGERAHAEMHDWPDTSCGGIYGSTYRIESGHFIERSCKTGPPPHYEVEDDLELATECTGFNKSLFD